MVNKTGDSERLLATIIKRKMAITRHVFRKDDICKGILTGPLCRKEAEIDLRSGIVIKFRRFVEF